MERQYKTEHTATCPDCGLDFEMNDLQQVFAHEHKILSTMENTVKAKKVIRNARDIYPYCGGQFATGVHVYMKGEPCPQRPCDDEHIQGWLCAERDNVNEKYILQF